MRRRTTDRRKYRAARRFPLKDRSGRIVPHNRSCRPDRRLQNYRLQELDGEDIQLYGKVIKFRRP